MHNIQYTISVNQLAIIRSGCEIDIIDAAIIDFVRHFIASEEMDIRDFDGERYYRLHSSHVSAQLPILGLKPEPITRRISALVEKGYFKRVIQDGNTPWIRPTSKAKSIYGGPSQETGGSVPKDGGGPSQKTDNNSTSNNIINTETQTQGAIAPSESVQDEMFEAFWASYPRKVSKGSARAAFAKALKKADVQDIAQGFKRFLASVEGKEERFIPHATTWLNGERWLDQETTESRVMNFN